MAASLRSWYRLIRPPTASTGEHLLFVFCKLGWIEQGVTLSRPRINWIEIVGFRSFGDSPQRVDFSPTVTCIWGSNSQGKTSLAEACEFLFTGHIARRTMMGSTQEEFYDSLRNVHIDDRVPTAVTAEIQDDSGATYRLKRTLVRDYGKRSDCETVLEIGGSRATEQDLRELGVLLADPPLACSILMQHTLTYLFSTRPQERADYFKALLQLTDLDTLRDEVASLESEVAPVDVHAVRRLHNAIKIEGLSDILLPLLSPPQSLNRIRRRLDGAIARLIRSSRQDQAKDAGGRIEQLKVLLRDLRSRTFWLEGFHRAVLTPWQSMDGCIASLEKFIELSKGIEQKTIRLHAMFEAALAIPTIARAREDVDCPLCETPRALTTTRIVEIRRILRENAEFQMAVRNAARAVDEIISQADLILLTTLKAIPAALQGDRSERQRRLFTVQKMRDVIGAEGGPLIQSWLSALRGMLRASDLLLNVADKVKEIVASYGRNIHDLVDITQVKDALEALRGVHAKCVTELDRYDQATEPLVVALKTRIDERGETAGWEDLIALAEQPEDLWVALRELFARSRVGTDLRDALRQIDEGKGRLLDENFGALSNDVAEWWELLRPDEPAYFHSVQRRPGAVRTVDFKAGLAAVADRSDQKLREAIAVLSHSQIHCLGLATFLARALSSDCGFIVLDDPVLTSDEDHRAPFISDGIAKLLGARIQTIVLTQDQKTRKDMEDLHEGNGIVVFHIDLVEPRAGTIVDRARGTVKAKLSKVRPFTRSASLTMRRHGSAELRDIAELILKRIIISDRRSRGGGSVVISDLDGLSIADLAKEAEPLLTEREHPGQMRFVSRTLSHGSHDDEMPSKGDLTTCWSHLVQFAKTYGAA